MSSILYVWQGNYPWDVRVEKIGRSLAQAGHKITLLARKRVEPMPPLPFEVLEVSSSFNAPLPWSPIWTRRIKQVISERKIDLVIARDFWITASSINAAEAMNIPCIIDMAEHYPAAMRGWKKYNSNLLHRWAIHGARIPDQIEKWHALHANGIMTVCEEQNERLIKMGVAAEDLEVIGNTPDLSFFFQEFAPPEKIIRIGHHGHITPERGLDVLIKAFALIKEKKPELQLVLAGAGESSDEIQAMIQKYKINCELQGRYKFSDLPKLISEVDAGILPYQLSELLDHTLANKLFDYMACRRPIFASNTRPFRRILNETKAGWIIDVTSPEKLAQDILNGCEHYQKEIANNGRQAIVSKYHWSADEKLLSRFVERYLG